MNREAVVVGLLREVQERYAPTAATLQEATSLLEEACKEKYPDDEFRFQLGWVKFACEREHGERPLVTEYVKLQQRLEQEQSVGKYKGYRGRLKELERELARYREETKDLAQAYLERRGQVLH